MFFYKKGLARRVRVHPKYMGGEESIQKVARKMAKQEIKDNSFTIEHGYVVRLICISNIGKGFCLPIHGLIEFSVTYEAILLYPVVGEVIHAEVEKVTDTCITFRYICMYGVVRSYSLNEEYNFEKEEEDKQDPPKVAGKTDTDAGKGDLYRCKIDPEKVITTGTVIRVRIMNRTVGGNGFFLIGSMSGEFLGPMKNPPAVPTTKTTSELYSSPPSSPAGSSNLISHGQLQKLWEKTPYNTDMESKSEAESEVLPD